MSRSYTSSPSSAFVACSGTVLALINLFRHMVGFYPVLLGGFWPLPMAPEMSELSWENYPWSSAIVHRPTRLPAAPKKSDSSSHEITAFWEMCFLYGYNIRPASHTAVALESSGAKWREFNYFIYLKKKVNQSRYTPWRRFGGEEYSSYSFSTSALDGGEWSASRPGRAFTPGERTQSRFGHRG
jgi:hypothetical protein